MPTKKKHAQSRHGRRADGKTATSISISERLLEDARKAAEEDGRSFSNWVEQVMKEALKNAGRLGFLILAGLLIYHIARGPRAWNNLWTGKLFKTPSSARSLRKWGGNA